MSHRVCPWWLGWFLASPLRKLRQNPHAILFPFVTEGMVVLEPGPGMGFFTLELARLAGPSGRVIAVDVQAKMLSGLRRRAGRAGLLERIETRQATDGGMGLGDLAGRVDFALAFAMVHEVPDPASFLAEVAATMKPGARLLIAEPMGHVTEQQLAVTLKLAGRAGLKLASRPDIRASRSAVLVRT